MTGQSLAERTAARRQQDAAPVATTIYEWLTDPEMRARDLEKLPLPVNVTHDFFTRMVIAAVQADGSIAQATKGSVFGAVIQALQLGLQPGPLEHVWITPKVLLDQQNLIVAEFMVGYKGLVELALRSPAVRDVSAVTVYEDDPEFVIQEGTEKGIWHTPLVDVDPDTARKVRCYYGVVRYVNGGHHQMLMTRADIEDHRASSPDPNSFFWEYRYNPMALKTVLRSMQTYMRLTPDIAQGLGRDGTVINSDETGAKPAAAQPAAEPAADES